MLSSIKNEGLGLKERLESILADLKKSKWSL